MRENTINIEFKSGINPLKRPSRNGQFLSECQNLYIEGEKLVPVEPIRYEIDEISGDYPFPQLFVCQRYTFLLEASAIHQVLDDWSLNTLYSDLSEYDTWHVADFEDFIVFTNGAVVICFPSRLWTCFEQDEPTPEISCFQYW